MNDKKEYYRNVVYAGMGLIIVCFELTIAGLFLDDNIYLLSLGFISLVIGFIIIFYGISKQNKIIKEERNRKF